MVAGKDKSITTVYIEKRIRDYCKKNKIVLSDWINSIFTNQFLNVDSKLKEIQEIEARKQKLLKEIEDIKERTESLSRNLSTREVRDIETIKARIDKGANHHAILRQFNTVHNRTFTMEEFKELVNIHEIKQERRLKFRTEKIKKNVK